MITQARLVQLTKHLVFITVSLLLSSGVTSCDFEKGKQQKVDQVSTALPNSGQHVLASLLTRQPSQGTVLYKGKLFTGYAVTFDNPKQFTSKVSYRDGVQSGESLKWFKDGKLSYQGNYKDGRLHGTSTSWWKNGNKRSVSHSVDGIGQGDQIQWYRSGAKFKLIKLKDGREEGIQQSWRENGKIYNNYEAKNGRIFGLKRSKLCFQLDDEEVKFANDIKDTLSEFNIPTPLISE